MSAPTRVEGRLTGAAGVELFWQGWSPADPPTGIVLICHGLGEHSGRYATVVDTLVPQGWAVYGLDHRGHGRSGGRRGHVDRYDDLLDDLDAFRRAIVARHPELPVFLLGHSMGGHVALAYALGHQDDLRGLVLSSPLLASNAVPKAAVGVLRGLARVAPVLRPAGVDPAKISKDPAVVADYRADPLVLHGNPTLGLTAALFGRFDVLIARAGELRLPLLLQYGSLDELADPSGSARLAAALGSLDRTVHRYPGLRHEIYHEPERADPLDDLRGWLTSHR